MGYYEIFVYGTLKHGEPNHFILQNPENGNSSYLGKARTSKRWPLVIASQYNIPYLLFVDGTGMHVFGEVYEVDDAMLHALDDLEDHPKYYERIKEDVIMDDSYSNLTVFKSCWIYFLKKYKPTLLKLPFLDDYSSYGSHGLEYVVSEDLADPEDI